MGVRGLAVFENALPNCGVNASLLPDLALGPGSWRYSLDGSSPDVHAYPSCPFISFTLVTFESMSRGESILRVAGGP